jgi:RND family efflux transporter MFP subunit
MNLTFKHTVVLVATACAAFASGCGKAPHSKTASAPELPVAPVKVQQIAARAVESSEEVSGTVRARLRATIEAKASGRITALPVVAGQKVRAGDLVARLEAPEIKARADLAQANLIQAEREWKRASSLQNQQAATRAELDVAESRHLASQAALAEAKAMLSYIEVLAPFDGVVARKMADVGDLAAPGKPLVEVEDPSNLQVEASVPELIASKVRADMTMPVRLGHSSDLVAGKVTEVSPVADPVSRTFRVKLDLPPNSGALSGQFARLFVPLGETSSLYIPASAVTRRGQLDIVFVVEDGKAWLHLVKIGRRLGGEVEVLSGLDSGDKVIVEGGNLLVDGQPVEIK